MNDTNLFIICVVIPVAIPLIIALLVFKFWKIDDPAKRQKRNAKRIRKSKKKNIQQGGYE